MREVDDAEVTMTEDHEYLHEGAPFTGVAVESRDGHRLCETHYEDGMRHGLRRRWYPGGALVWTEERFHQNCAHGLSQEWYESGLLRRETQFEMGHVLFSTSWDQSGEVEEEYTLSESDPAYRLLQLSRVAYPAP